MDMRIHWKRWPYVILWLTSKLISKFQYKATPRVFMDKFDLSNKIASTKAHSIRVQETPQNRDKQIISSPKTGRRFHVAYARKKTPNRIQPIVWTSDLRCKVEKGNSKKEKKARALYRLSRLLWTWSNVVGHNDGLLCGIERKKIRIVTVRERESVRGIFRKRIWGGHWDAIHQMRSRNSG